MAELEIKNYLTEMKTTPDVTNPAFTNYTLNLIAELNTGENSGVFFIRELTEEEKCDILHINDKEYYHKWHSNLDCDILLFSNRWQGDKYELVRDDEIYRQAYENSTIINDCHYIVFKVSVNDDSFSTYEDLGYEEDENTNSYSNNNIYAPSMYSLRTVSSDALNLFVPAKDFFDQFQNCYPVIGREDILPPEDDGALFMDKSEYSDQKFFQVKKEYSDLMDSHFERFNKVLIDQGLDIEGNRLLTGPYSYHLRLWTDDSKQCQIDIEGDNTKIYSLKKRNLIDSILCPESVDQVFLLEGVTEKKLQGLKTESMNENIVEETSVDKLLKEDKNTADEMIVEGSIDLKVAIHYSVPNDKCWELTDVTNEEDIEKFRNDLFDKIQKRRNSYKKNVINNIMICITQGFLTVFSGAPGCGKTSICDILSDVLGLNLISEYAEPSDKKCNAGRYISVPVAQGWTSKRDFIGYYNSLYNRMEQSNLEVYDLFDQLNKEKQEGSEEYPCMILLDEANLSPLEYYWSDFMKIGDQFFDFTKDHKPSDNARFNASIEIGNDTYHFSETLRFLATINNDYSTSPLSPRLIDRAWVITLPKVNSVEIPKMSGGALNSGNNSDGKCVTWNMLRAAFDSKDAQEIDDDWNNNSSKDIREIYKNVVDLIENMHISVSPRSARTIKRYWATAKDIFRKETNKKENVTIQAPIVALDYAIAQKILPHIEGVDKSQLEQLKSECENAKLYHSVDLIQGIIENGDSVGYYKFFS